MSEQIFMFKDGRCPKCGGHTAGQNNSPMRCLQCGWVEELPPVKKPPEHALLSASSAERWLNCTRAPRLEETLPETTSEYAEEGRLAHSIAELKVKKNITDTSMKAGDYTAKMVEYRASPLYQEEMQGYADFYLEYITEATMKYASRPYVAVEVRVDYGHVVPEGFGTSDCIMIGGDTLQVTDYKYGKGVPVSAEDNPQMKLYALGALKVYAPIYGDGIKKVRIAIIQPRLDSISESEITVEELRSWAESIRPRAELAYNGLGEFVPGEWCRFCRARSTCRARNNIYSALEDFKNTLPPLLSDAEVGDILKRAQSLKDWVADLEEYTLKSILAGKPMPGWKSVEGRSNRTYVDTVKVADALKAAGYAEAVIYERNLYGITAMEKIVGKKDFAKILNGLIIKPPGKPTLALENDKRPAYSPAAADFAGLEKTTNEKGEATNV